MTEIKIKSLDQLPQAAEQFINSIDPERTVITFDGAMGAGKTTFITALVKALGVDDDEAASSPTFAIINEYRSDTTAQLIYHFDLYRVESLDEALDLGIEDYLDSGALCLIEWPDRIADLLPDDVTRVHISVDDDTDERTLTID